MRNQDIFYGKSAKEKISKIVLAGKKSLYVLADFDKTLTYARTNGEETPSLISVLYNRWYLSKDYSDNAKHLAEIYRPIESDYAIPLEKRREQMLERWTKHRELLIESGLSRKHIQKVVDSWIIKLRDWSHDLFETLHSAGVPLVILSASWLGKDAISMYLEKQQLLSDKVYIISNGFERDDQDRAIGYQEPIITSLNKDETIISQDNFPSIYEDIVNRKNVMLLGDQVEDIGMASGHDHELLLTIGFLNNPTQEKIGYYKEYFDIVLLWDVNMEEIIKITKHIVQ